MPGYTAQTPMELQSGLEQLHTKMFSCVNASHALGGLSAGGSVFPPPPLNSTMRTNWPGYDELPIYFKTEKAQAQLIGINCFIEECK